MSQMWKPRHREARGAGRVLSRSVLTAGSRALIHPVTRPLRDVKPWSWSAATGQSRGLIPGLLAPDSVSLPPKVCNSAVLNPVGTVEQQGALNILLPGPLWANGTESQGRALSLHLRGASQGTAVSSSVSLLPR